MGVHISFVRSITMDGWSKIQLKRMQNGGNLKLKQFWKDQKFPNGLTPLQRLDNDTMDKYRENLLKQAKGESVNKIPFCGYQKREIQPRKFDNKSMKGFGNTPIEEEQNVFLNYLIAIVAIGISYYVYKYLF